MLLLHGLVDRFWWFRGTAAFIFCLDSSTLTVGWWVLPSSCQRLHSATGNCGLIVYAFVLILLLWYLSNQMKGHYMTWHLCSYRYIYKVVKSDLLLCHVSTAAHLCGTAWLLQNRFSLNFISGDFYQNM